MINVICLIIYNSICEIWPSSVPAFKRVHHGTDASLRTELQSIPSCVIEELYLFEVRALTCRPQFFRFYTVRLFFTV